MDAGQGGSRGPSDIATLTAAAVAAVEASVAAGPLPAPAEARESPLLSLSGGTNSSREVKGAASNGTPTVVAASVFSAAAAAAGISHTTLPIAATTKSAAAPKRKRLMRLESGDLVVIPTNIYRQAGGVKLDITLGGFRIDNEKCTLKNRAYNFGVLPGFTRENLLALRAFRDTLLPTDRSKMPSSIHTIIAAEAMIRYDEEHVKPPEGSSLAEESSHYGAGRWIPDSRVIHMTYTGSDMELRVKAGDLRAVNRPLQCKMALEALKSDPKVLEGKLEPAPPSVDVYGSGGAETVGSEPGATGFSRSPESLQPASSDTRSGGRRVAGGGEGRGSRAPVGGANAEFSLLFGGAAAFANDGFVDDHDNGRPRTKDLDSTSMHRRRKKKKKTVVVPAATEEGGEGGESAVEYDLPLHVQIVEGKQCRPSLRLKVPLTGFMVDGEIVPSSELVVAHGLDITKKNLLALRACCDAVLANFAAPDLVKRAIAGEIFRVWTRRRGEDMRARRSADAILGTAQSPGISGLDESPTAPAMHSDVVPVVDSGSPVLLERGGSYTQTEAMQEQQEQQQQEKQQQQQENEPSGEGAVAAAAAEMAELAELAELAEAATGGTMLSSPPAEVDSDTVSEGGDSGAPANSHLVVTPAITRAAVATEATAPPVGGLGVLSGALGNDDVFTLSSPTSFPGGPRIELRMTASELRRARQTKATALKKLLATMLQDAKVQAGKLDVVHGMSSPAITRSNLSGAAAAAAAAEAAAVVKRANLHTTALLVSGKEEREKASRSSNNAVGNVGYSGRDIGSKVAERWGATLLLHRVKRARAADSSPLGPCEVAAPGDISVMPITTASSQRRQLWALAIRENELRHERMKEDSRSEYDVRQQELVSWMVDEEAGRHDHLDGTAGPPPPVWLDTDR
ncbi:unnamed protein product [Ectocarpus sp. 4 AP-2014]